MEECKIGRVWDWKSVGLEECRIGRVKDWKSVRLEECKKSIRLDKCVILWITSDL